MPAQDKMTVLQQIVELIPPYLVPKLARAHGVDERSRTFSPWSHVVSLLYAQLAHSLSLNDVCDALRHHAPALFQLRGATPPSRNGLSHANRERSADLAEALFWAMLERLQEAAPSFAKSHCYVGCPRRFKRLINVVDSTTLQLVANCLDWARHRRRKAAAKCHLCLDMKTLLPRFALIKEGKSSDPIEARDLCAQLQAGEIVVFDRAYVDFVHLAALHRREVCWVTRAKTNLQYHVVGEHSAPKGAIRRDVLIRLTGQHTHRDYAEPVRLIEAEVKVQGRKVTMTFLTNNQDWAASSVVALYKGRWGVEVFFKQLKQTLQLADFLGHSENAVRWQVWMALLTYVLLRFLAWRSQWTGSFSRLFTTARAVLWNYFNLVKLLRECCGTAAGRLRTLALPDQAYLPGILGGSCGTAPGLAP